MLPDSQVWSEPDKLAPSLREHEIHVWRLCVPRAASIRPHVEPLLAAEEVARAERFHFEQHRLIYILGRGLLRMLLGSYLGHPAKELRFSTNEHGKPTLATEPSTGLQFNLSHSGDWIVHAVTRGRAVGIDIEQVRPRTNLEAIARRFFSPQEVAVLFALPEAEREAAFFRCWSRKEAYIKAVGRGMSIPLDAFDVSLAPGEPARLLEARGEAIAPGPWDMQALDVTAGYAAAVAAHGTGWSVRCWDWPRTYSASGSEIGLQSRLER